MIKNHEILSKQLTEQSNIEKKKARVLLAQMVYPTTMRGKLKQVRDDYKKEKEMRRSKSIELRHATQQAAILAALHATQKTQRTTESDNSNVKEKEYWDQIMNYAEKIEYGMHKDEKPADNLLVNIQNILFTMNKEENKQMKRSQSETRLPKFYERCQEAISFVLADSKTDEELDL